MDMKSNQKRIESESDAAGNGGVQRTDPTGPGSETGPAPFFSRRCAGPRESAEEATSPPHGPRRGARGASPAAGAPCRTLLAGSAP